MGKQLEGTLDYRKLCAALKKQKLSTKSFAETLGISYAHLEHIMSGYRNPSSTLYRLICAEMGVPYGEFMIQELPRTETVENLEAQQDKQIDRIETQLDRMERKLDRLEMIVRSVQNENLALRQELLKRK